MPFQYNTYIRIVLVPIITFTYSLLFGQQIVPCTSQHIHDHHLESEVSYFKAFNQFLEQRDQALEATSDKSNCPTYRIPVAFHYQPGLIDSTDIPCVSAILTEQLAVMNSVFDELSYEKPEDLECLEWFEFLSGPYPACTDIRFLMAAKSHPSGYGLSDGDPAITLNNTNVDWNRTRRFTDTGMLGDTTWKGYFNVFVVDSIAPPANVNGIVAGFSHVIAGSFDGRGITIRKDFLGSNYLGGRTCPSAPHANDYWVDHVGHTLSHEAGHYMGLFHPWGMTSATPTCGTDDGINDTPRSKITFLNSDSVFDITCDQFTALDTNSCMDLPGEFPFDQDPPDMWFNIMTYAKDECTCAFTYQQGLVMNQRAFVRDTTYSNFGDRLGEVITPRLAHTFLSQEGNPTANNLAIQFEDQSYEGSNPNNTSNIQVYYWTFFGAGVVPYSSTEKEPVVMVRKSGPLYVRLTVSNYSRIETIYDTIQVDFIFPDGGGNNPDVTFQDKLEPVRDTTTVYSNAHFGSAIAVDDSIMVVGAPFQQTDAGVEAGAAYVYRYNGTNWIEEQVLEASTAKIGDRFGYQVDVLGDYIAITAIRKKWELVGANRFGAVYLFHYDGTQWNEIRQFPHNSSFLQFTSNSAFGESIKLKEDYLFVGVPRNSEAGLAQQGSNHGLIMQYGFDSLGNVLSAIELFSNDQLSGEQMGTDMALVGDRVIAAAPFGDINNIDGSGIIRMSECNVPFCNMTTGYDTLTNTMMKEDEHLGYRMDSWQDRIAAAINLKDTSGTRYGAVQIYEKTTNWMLEQQVSPTIPNTLFGSDVVLRGKVLAVGADQGWNSSGYRTGVTYVYVQDSTGWQLYNDLTGIDSDEFDQFGFALAISDDFLFIGAPEHDGLDQNSGAVYIIPIDQLHCNGMEILTNNFIMETKTIEADFIHIMSEVTSGSDILFSAGQEAIMYPGFDVDSTSTYEVEIKQCPVKTGVMY